MQKYVSFLRGINVGGKRVPMKELKSVFEQMGFNDVKTLLNTGNVLFTGEQDKLEEIQPTLAKTFGFEIDVITFTFHKLETIISSHPFLLEVNDPKIKYYLTFFKEIRPTTLKLPYTNDDESIKILSMTDTTIYGLVNLHKSGTVEYMKILDKEYGKKLTTRNFNTVKKLAAL